MKPPSFLVRCCLVLLCLAPVATAQDADTMTLLSVQQIWDAAPHNAFTDLIRFRDTWYCTFRESAAHVGGDGAIRILRSQDGTAWESAAVLREQGIDLRDPKLSETPDGRLMAVMGGSVYRGTELVGRQPRVAFSQDGSDWTTPQRILEEGDWLWRVTWHAGRAYGVSYRSKDDGRHLLLFSSEDGVRYTEISELAVDGEPNETTLRFLADGTMLALVRRESGDTHAWFGRSQAPYTEWTWSDIGHRLGGPNFLLLPDGRCVTGGRDYREPRTMRLGWLEGGRYTPVLTLPSGGDTSYPGMVWHDGVLWVSYYSSHEGKSSIYLAQVRVP